MRRFPALFVLLLVACGERAAEAPVEGAPVVLLPEQFEGTWRGVLPCADCEGVDTTIALVRDGDVRRYSRLERYLGTPLDAQSGEGDWREVATTIAGEAGAVVVLEDTGQHWWRRPDGGLEAVDARHQPVDNTGAQRLQRM